jgi:hypothetical protein
VKQVEKSLSDHSSENTQKLQIIAMSDKDKIERRMKNKKNNAHNKNKKERLIAFIKVLFFFSILRFVIALEFLVCNFSLFLFFFLRFSNKICEMLSLDRRKLSEIHFIRRVFLICMRRFYFVVYYFHSKSKKAE